MTPRFALCLCLLTGGAWALPAETWVVTIGNNVGNGEDVELLYAERDAQTLAEALRVGSGVATKRISMVLGERDDEVRKRIEQTNAEIRERAGAGADTALIVFFSGHSDAEALHLAGTELRLEELKTLVNGSAAGVRLLVVDACRSGTVTRVKGVKPAPAFTLSVEENVATEGTAIITSSAAGEASQESDRLGASFFSHHLVNALRGAADDDGDGLVTLHEAYAYTYAQTLRSSGDTLALQHPTYAFNTKGRGDLVLSAPAASRARAARLKLGAPAVYLVIEGKHGGAVTAEVAAAKAGTTLTLRSGTYLVQQRLPAEYREYEVALDAEHETDVSVLPFQTVKYDRLVRARGGEVAATHRLTVASQVRGDGGKASLFMVGVSAGWGMDLSWASFFVRGRYNSATSTGYGPRSLDQIAGGGGLERYVDFSHLSLGFGVLVEGDLTWQRQLAGRLPRQNVALAATAFLFAERQLGAGFSARLEVGGTSEFVQLWRSKAVAENVTYPGDPPLPPGSAVGPPVSWTSSLGVQWRL